MSRDTRLGTLVSEGEDKTITTDQDRLSVAEARRRAWLGLEQGEILGGRFRIQELIQSGGMGDVYRATDLVEHTDVAVKTLRSGGMGVRRFEREAMHLSQLKHPSIPRYIAHDLRAEQGPYLVMEWLDGLTLADRLRQQRIGIQSALALMSKVGEAVAAAHLHGLIHRDINPSNIFLMQGSLSDVRVLDFGVARLAKDDLPLTAEGTQIGTPGYMAPEQVEGSAEVQATADVFALGCVLYELVTGQRAFTAPTIRELLNRILTEQPISPRELNHLAQPPLERLILRCLEKEPSLRPEDATRFVEALRELPAHEERVDESVRPSRASSHAFQQVTSVIVLRGSEEGLLEKVKQVARPFGLRVHQGSESTVVVSTQGKGTASDHAVAAARCALSIQRVARVPTVAVATGLFLQHGDVPSGRAFDSALVSLLLRDRGGDLGTTGAALWLDENTASLLDSRFDVRQVEQGYLLRGLRDTHEPSRTVLGRRTRCVGRKRELSMLQATLGESFEDRVASSVLVTGPPGVGKTRLVSELVRAARRDRPGLEVLRAHGESLTAGAPMAILSQMIAWACHIKDDDPQALRARKLKQRLSRTLSGVELTRVAGFLADSLGIVTDEFDSQELRVARRDAVLRGDQLNRALEDWLRAECSKASVLIVLDDFQWGDLASVKLVDNLLRNLSEQPLVVVCLARPEVHELFPKLWVRRGVTELRLGGISRRAAASMIEEILGQDVPDAVIERVIQRAQGNPFWIEELLRAEKSGQGESVPDRVVLLAQSRIEQLSLVERRVLEAGSVFGRSFSESGVAAVVGSDLGTAQVKDALRELVDGEILLLRDTRTQATDLFYEFSSGLLRDAAYSLVDGDEREEAHCRAAEYLERAGDAEHLAIALHFSLGGALERARPHYLGAALQALSGDDMENAVACAEEGLSCGAQGAEAARLHLIHAEASKWRGDHAVALSSARKAVDFADGASELWFRALGEAAVAAGKLGQRALAAELGQQLLGTEAGQELEERRIALSRVATQMSLVGNVDLARELVASAEVSDGAIEPDPRVLGFLEEARAVLAGALGDPVGRVTYADAGVQHFELAGDHRNACFLRLSQGFAEVELGENRRAVVSLTEAVRVAERMGLENSIPVGQAQLGRALFRLGKPDEAEKLLEQAASTFDRQKNVRLAGMTRIYLAELALSQGEIASAKDALVRAIGILESVPVMRRIAHALLAAVRASLGEVDEAKLLGELALDGLASDTRLPFGESIVRLGAAEGLRAAGEVTRAAQLLEEERARIQLLVEQLRGSRGLGTSSEELCQSYLKGSPERAYLSKLDLESWSAGKGSYLEHLRQIELDDGGPPAMERPVSDLVVDTKHEVEHVLAEPRIERALALMSSHYEKLGRAFSSVLDPNNASYCHFAQQMTANTKALCERRELRERLLQATTARGRELLGLSGLAALALKALGLYQRVQLSGLTAVEKAALLLLNSRRKLHEELTPLMAQFIALLEYQATEGELAAFTDQLRPGPADEGGQEVLKEAFLAYFEGHQAQAPATKAQLILLGNCSMSLYEQTRLQRHLYLAADVSIEQVFQDVLDDVLPSWFPRVLRRAIRYAARGYVALLGTTWQKIVHRLAMKISVPDPALIAWDDVPSVRVREFPSDLKEITERRLCSMSQRFDPQFGTSQRDGSNNWSDLRDRMGYLLEILRARQQERAYLDSGGSAEQRG